MNDTHIKGIKCTLLWIGFKYISWNRETYEWSFISIKDYTMERKLNRILLMEKPWFSFTFSNCVYRFGDTLLHAKIYALIWRGWRVCWRVVSCNIVLYDNSWIGNVFCIFHELYQFGYSESAQRQMKGNTGSEWKWTFKLSKYTQGCPMMSGKKTGKKTIQSSSIHYLYHLSPSAEW